MLEKALFSTLCWETSNLICLLTIRYLKEGVTPTTSKIGVLKHGDEHKILSEGSEREIIQIPVEWLRDISLVDTPGTNAVVRGKTLLR
jgi:hypothetical protein